MGRTNCAPSASSRREGRSDEYGAGHESRAADRSTMAEASSGSTGSLLFASCRTERCRQSSCPATDDGTRQLVRFARRRTVRVSR